MKIKLSEEYLCENKDYEYFGNYFLNILKI